MFFSRLGLSHSLGLLLILGLLGCSKSPTSLLLDISGDAKVTLLVFDLSLTAGGQVSRSLPLAKPLPGRVVVELPDLAQVVTIDATGTGSGVEHKAHVVVTATPHRQTAVMIHLGDPVLDMTSTSDLPEVDLAGADFADFAGIDLAGTGDLAGAAPDLKKSSDLPSLDLPGNSLVVLAGQYGGPGSHDDVGIDARFTQLEGAARIGNTLYVAEHYTDRIRTVDLTTGQTGSIALSPADADMAPTSCGPAGLLADGANFLYAACYDQHTISRIEIATGIVTLLVGVAKDEGFADGGPGVARFSKPWGLALDSAGFLWVSDSGNKKLRRIDLSGPMVSTPPLVDSSPTDMGATTTFVEPHGMTLSGTSLYVSDGGGVVRVDPISSTVYPLISKTKLAWATDVAVIGTNLYVVDNVLNSLWRFPIAAPQTGTLIAGANVYAGQSADGIGLAARFQNPEYLVAGSNSNELFVVEYVAVRRVALDTITVSTFAGRGDHRGFRDGNDPLLRTPMGMVFDGDDTIYFSEYEGYRIRKYTISTQQVSLVAGTGESGYLDGPALSAQFYGTAGLAVDNEGNLYIAEDLVHVVRKLDKISGNISTIAGLAGVTGPPGADGLAGTANRLDAPWGLVFDGDHSLFLSEKGNSVVRTIDLNTADYKMALLVGTGVRSVDDNTNGKLANFDGPAGLAYDRARKILYISESNGETVRRTDLSIANRPVTTVSGVVYQAFNDEGVPPGDGGPLDSTYHRTPNWLALSADGNRLYVSNTDGETIQRLDLAGNVSQTIVGAPMQGFVRPGLLPARIQIPEGITLTPFGLVIASYSENVLLVATSIAP